jgi:hypothetical protein
MHSQCTQSAENMTKTIYKQHSPGSHLPAKSAQSPALGLCVLSARATFINLTPSISARRTSLYNQQYSCPNRYIISHAWLIARRPIMPHKSSLNAPNFAQSGKRKRSQKWSSIILWDIHTSCHYTSGAASSKTWSKAAAITGRAR